MKANVETSKRRNVKGHRFGRPADFLWTLLIALLFATSVHGAQHLVAPGASWSELAERVRPGDEIILMPGRHQPGLLDDLHGTREKPITIRALSTDQPSIIEARQHGIRLRRPQHIVIRDLAVTGATISGIHITNEKSNRDGRPGAATPRNVSERTGEPPWPAHITIRNITIENTGPRGRRNAIHLEGVRQVLIERVRIAGWGGAAIKVLGSSDVRIENSIMRGREGHSQFSGVHISGGSDNVRITRCFFGEAGEAAVVLGEVEASSQATERTEERFDAQRVTVERNVIRRGDAAFAFLSAKNCIVRNNTILNPIRFAYFIAPPGILLRTSFGANIIVWEPDVLESTSHLQPPAKADGLLVEQNLWWGGKPSSVEESLLGNVRSPQITDVDPDLDQQFKPQSRRAQMFGTEGP